MAEDEIARSGAAGEGEGEGNTAATEAPRVKLEVFEGPLDLLLHLIKKEFGLRPVTFTYDWGMVTDLARRNVARICGQLGIQNILVSADIAQKRENCQQLTWNRLRISKKQRNP